MCPTIKVGMQTENFRDSVVSCVSVDYHHRWSTAQRPGLGLPVSQMVIIQEEMLDMGWSRRGKLDPTGTSVPAATSSNLKVKTTALLPPSSN